MKFITVLVLYLAFSHISLNICGTVSRNHRYRNTRRTSTRTSQANNKWYQLFVGLIFGLAGSAQDMSALNNCVPNEWKAVDTSPATAGGDAPPQKSLFIQIIDQVEKIINFVCAFKSKIMGLLGMKIRRLLRRNRYRMFVETRVNLRKVLWGFGNIGRAFQNVGRQISNTAKNVGRQVSNTAQNVGRQVTNTAQQVGKTVTNTAQQVGKGIVQAANTVAKTAEQSFEHVKGLALSAADWAKKRWDEVVSFATGIVSKLKTFYSNAVNTVKTFFSGDLVGKIKKIVECAMGLTKLLKGLFDVIKGIKNKITYISRIAAQDYTALAQLIIDLICNFSLFRQAFTFLIDGIHEKDTIKKFSLIGKFLGTGFRALVVRRLKHHKN